MKLLITSYAWEKILAYTDLCPAEISGLGKVKVIGDDFVVVDVAIFEQTVSSAHSTIETKALAKFQHEQVKKGESMKEWVLWWHSHADMSVFFSGTDTGTIDGSTDFPYLVSLVVNKKHEKEARFDLFRPVRMKTEKLTVEILQVSDAKIKKQCQKDIDNLVNIPKEKPEPKGTGYTYIGKRTEVQTYKGREVEMRDIPWASKEYTESIQEYYEHRKWLVARLAKLKGNKDDESRKEYTETQRALSEWDSYARQMHLIVGKDE